MFPSPVALDIEISPFSPTQPFLFFLPHTVKAPNPPLSSVPSPVAPMSEKEEEGEWVLIPHPNLKMETHTHHSLTHTEKRRGEEERRKTCAPDRGERIVKISQRQIRFFSPSLHGLFKEIIVLYILHCGDVSNLANPALLRRVSPSLSPQPS